MKEKQDKRSPGLIVILPILLSLMILLFFVSEMQRKGKAELRIYPFSSHVAVQSDTVQVADISMNDDVHLFYLLKQLKEPCAELKIDVRPDTTPDHLWSAFGTQFPNQSCGFTVQLGNRAFPIEDDRQYYFRVSNKAGEIINHGRVVVLVHEPSRPIPLPIAGLVSFLASLLSIIGFYHNYRKQTGFCV